MNKRKVFFTSLMGGILWALIWTVGMYILGKPLNYSGVLGGIIYCVVNYILLYGRK